MAVFYGDRATALQTTPFIGAGSGGAAVRAVYDEITFPASIAATDEIIWGGGYISKGAVIVNFYANKSALIDAAMDVKVGNQTVAQIAAASGDQFITGTELGVEVTQGGRVTLVPTGTITNPGDVVKFALTVNET